jgi:ligand-binding sensor domain-containing protein
MIMTTLLGVVNSLAAQSPEPVFRNFTVGDGLPSSEVYHVIQDKHGYMWFATDRGVSWFDGYTFHNYTLKDSLTDNTVLKLFEASDGKIWCSTFNHKLCYIDNGAVFTYQYNSIIEDRIRDNAINIGLYVDDKNTVHLGYSGGAYLEIDKDGKEVHHLINSPNGVAYYVLEVIDDVLLTYTNKPKPLSLAEPEAARGTIQLLIENRDTLFHNDTNTNKGKFHSIKYGLKTRDGDYYALSQGHVFGFDAQKNFFQLKMKQTPVFIYETRDKNLWIGHFKGGIKRYPKRLNFDNYRHYLNGRSVTSIFEDREGGMWFTTLEDGVFYTPSLEMVSFSTELTSGTKINAITGNGQHEIYVAYENGYVDVLSTKGKKATLDIYGNKKKRSINALYYHKEKQALYCGGGGISIVKDTIVQYLGRTAGIILSFVEGKNNRTYMGTNYSVAILTGDSTLTELMRSPIRAKCLYPTEENTFIIGSKNGLWEYKDSTYQSLSTWHPLLKYRIEDIAKMGEKYLLASIGAGLIVYGNDSIYNIGTADGLNSESTSSIHIDNRNDVWVGSNKGVNRIRFEGDNYSITSYTKLDGLVSNEVTDVYSQNDTIYVGTKHGLSFFSPAQIIEGTIPPLIYLNNIKVNDRLLNEKNNVVLPYNQNQLEIDFIGITYRDAGNVQYKYKLVGGDKSWGYTNSKSVRYSALKPGSYTFLVYAQSKEGIWSENPVRIQITINPPFWQTWWFIGLAILGIVLIMTLIFWRRYQQLKTGEQLKRNMLELKGEALQSQMNPHFIFNSLNSIQGFISEHDKKSAEVYLAKFARLIRATLDHSGQKYIHLDKEIELITNYIELEQMRFRDEFTYEVKIDGELDESYLKIPPLLIQPFVENAILHGLTPKTELGNVSVVFKQIANGQMHCTIEDDGIGREKSQAMQHDKIHKSKGIRISKERIEALGAANGQNFGIVITDLKNGEGEATGTRVELILPLIKEDE